jgi:hypothetical protein
MKERIINWLKQKHIIHSWEIQYKTETRYLPHGFYSLPNECVIQYEECLVCHRKRNENVMSHIIQQELFLK